MKRSLILVSFLFLAACGPKVKLVPRAYMPEPPEVLMRAPKDLNTIKPVEEPNTETATKDE